jgi:hypothetical protein
MMMMVEILEMKIEIEILYEMMMMSIYEFDLKLLLFDLS